MAFTQGAGAPPGGGTDPGAGGPGGGAAPTPGTGTGGGWNAYSLTTNAVANTIDNTDYGWPVYNTLIINDGTDDIEFGFGITTATASFFLAPGEILSIDLVYQVLYYESASATQAFRILVVW